MQVPNEGSVFLYCPSVLSICLVMEARVDFGTDGLKASLYCCKGGSQSPNVIGPNHILGVDPRNLSSFTSPLLTRRRGIHKLGTIDSQLGNIMCVLLHMLHLLRFPP